MFLIPSVIEEIFVKEILAGNIFAEFIFGDLIPKLQS